MFHFELSKQFGRFAQNYSNIVKVTSTQLNRYTVANFNDADYNTVHINPPYCPCRHIKHWMSKTSLFLIIIPVHEMIIDYRAFDRVSQVTSFQQNKHLIFKINFILSIYKLTTSCSFKKHSFRSRKIVFAISKAICWLARLNFKGTFIETHSKFLIKSIARHSFIQVKLFAYKAKNYIYIVKKS